MALSGSKTINKPLLALINLKSACKAVVANNYDFNIDLAPSIHYNRRSKVEAWPSGLRQQS